MPDQSLFADHADAEQTQARLAEFELLVAAVATGYPVELPEAERILDASGMTVAELERAVKYYRAERSPQSPIDARRAAMAIPAAPPRPAFPYSVFDPADEPIPELAPVRKPAAKLQSENNLRPDMPLSKFYSVWFLTIVLDARKVSKATKLLYADTIGYWVKITRDPPINKIDEAMIRLFCEGLKAVRFRRTKFGSGRYPLSLMTRRKHLRNIRTILFRVGPNDTPGRPSVGLLPRRIFVPSISPRHPDPEFPDGIVESPPLSSLTGHKRAALKLKRKSWVRRLVAMPIWQREVIVAAILKAVRPTKPESLDPSAPPMPDKVPGFNPQQRWGLKVRRNQWVRRIEAMPLVERRFIVEALVKNVATPTPEKIEAVKP